MAEPQTQSGSGHAHRAVVEQIAATTGAPLEVVGDLYERELESLQREARVAQFVGVIATRRVLLNLRQHRGKDPESDDRAAVTNPTHS